MEGNNDAEDEHIAIARRSVKGSVVLFGGQFASTAIAAVASILIARLLGPPSYGIYTLATVIPAILALFTGLGLNASVTRFAAHYSSLGRRAEAARYTRHAILFMFLTGTVLAAVNLVAAPFLSAVILHRADIAGYVELASLAVIGTTLFNGVFGAALGWEEMELASTSYLVENISKLVLAVGLLVAGFGILGALLGHLSGYLVAGGFLLLLLYARKLRAKDEGVRGEGKFVSDIREMVRYGFPTYLSGILTGLGLYYVTVILAAIASNASVGFYQAATNVAVVTGLASGAIANALFPAFTSLHGIKGQTALAFNYAVKYTCFFLSPLIFFLALAAPQLVHVFYGASFDPSVAYVVLLAFSFLPIVIGQNAAVAFFNGVGLTRLSLIASAVGAVTLFVSAPLLGITMGLGIDGLIYALTISNFVTAIACLVLAREALGATIDVKAVVMTLASSLLSLAVAYVAARPLAFSNVLTLVTEVVLFAGAYLTPSPLLGALSRPDVERLSAVFEELGFIWVAVRPFVRYELRLTGVGRRRSEKPEDGPTNR